MESTSQSIPQRRIRRTREQWQALVTRFEDSGQTPDQFCAEMGIGQSTLRRWCSRLREPASVAPSSTPVFVELPHQEERAGGADHAWEVELQLGGGVLLRLRRAPC